MRSNILGDLENLVGNFVDIMPTISRALFGGQGQGQYIFYCRSFRLG